MKKGQVQLAVLLSGSLMQVTAQAAPMLSDLARHPQTASVFNALIAHQHLPSWIRKGGVESPMQQVTLKGETYQVYTACQPHNCAQQKFALLYSPKHQQMSGLWLRNDEKNQRETLRWLNLNNALSIDGKTVLYAAMTGSLDNHPTAFNYQ